MERGECEGIYLYTVFMIHVYQILAPLPRIYAYIMG